MTDGIRTDLSDFLEWQLEIGKFSTDFPNETGRVLLESAEWVRDQAKALMPVDTGAARARWGSQVGSAGIWRIQDGGNTIEQGASLEPYEYIERLNEGWSQQAPAGFLDTAAQYGEYRLQDNLEREMAKLLEGR